MFELCYLCNRVDGGTSGVAICAVCNSYCHVKCLGSLWTPRDGANWCCNECISSSLPFADAYLCDAIDDTMNTNHVLLANHHDNCLDVNEINDECRFLLMDDGIDADINFYNMRSSYSSTYKEVEQLPEFFSNIKATNHFCITHLNGRGINLKLAEISLLLAQSNTMILALTETWLTDDLASTISLPGFNFIHSSRANGKGRGGVGFFIRSDIVFEIIQADWTKSKLSTFESMFVKLPQPKSKDIIIGSIYRPPGQPINDFTTDFENTLLNLSNSKSRVFLAGDFNVNLLR
jgi:hypothetical protein